MREFMIIVEGNDGGTPSTRFMTAFEAATTENWFDDRERVFGDHAALEVWAAGDATVHISGIRSLARGTGGGTAALKFICDLADKFDVTLDGTAKAFGSGGLTTRELLGWYIRHGFKLIGGSAMDGYEIERSKPAKQRTLKLGKNTRVLPLHTEVGGDGADGADAPMRIKLHGKRQH